MTNWMTTFTNLGIVLAVLGSVMFVADVGVGQTYEVITADDGNVTADTFTAFGQANCGQVGANCEVGFIDRVTTAAIALTILTGLGVLTVGRNNPAILNQVLRYYPLLGLAIGITEFGSEVMDMITSEYDWDAHSAGQNAVHMAAAGWVISGLAKLLMNR